MPTKGGLLVYFVVVDCLGGLWMGWVGTFNMPSKSFFLFFSFSFLGVGVGGGGYQKPVLDPPDNERKLALKRKRRGSLRQSEGGRERVSGRE